MKIKEIIGGAYKDGNCYFELCYVNGRKINKASRKYPSYPGNFVAEAREMCDKLEAYINNKEVNGYPFYDGDTEINYIGLNKSYAECISIEIKDSSEKIRNGNYLLIADIWYDTAECGYVNYFCFESLEETVQKGLTIIKDKFQDELDELPSNEDILECLRKSRIYSEEHHGLCVSMKIYEVVSLPKNSTIIEERRPLVSIANVLKNHPI